MTTLFLIAVAFYALWVRRRVRAIRDVPELMRVLKADYDPQLRCIWPGRRGEDRLFLDSTLSKERLFAASVEAERAGLVVRIYQRGMIGGDTFVGIEPSFVQRFWSDAGPGDPPHVHQDGGQWLEPEPVPWLSSFVNLPRVAS